MMELVAERLGEALREELVFVGGAVAGLLITDPAHPTIRPTEDVDLIVHAATRADYQRVEDVLRRRGFVNDMSADAPICRWRVGAVTVDVMPTLEDILGFSNRWYPLALETADKVSLPSGTQIRLVTAPVFVGTKLEAFAHRGQNDYLFSHDLGDLISVIDGRDQLIAECFAQDAILKKYLRERFRDFLATPEFRDALPGHLPGDAASQARLPDLEDKLRLLAELE
ncbi:MAG: nucleotidyl transferase AbiEii/AbiGii toxin family protein [Rhodocyclales bacterium]|nr:nucleotidyl transferase AbiEii/AbiGii toxin family protein [Rhodocyclales bacterium]